MPPQHEVVAVRVGTLESTRAETYYRYAAYGEPDGPLELDYFFWVVRSEDGTTLVDTGFARDAAVRRGRTMTVEPVVALAALGIEAEEVSRVVVSHFHYDHIGNVAAFPSARVVLQARELAFWTGPYARHTVLAGPTERAEIEYLAAAVRDGRAEVIDGDAELAPGITARLVGGHCPGQQVVLVDTATAPVVLASDALHFYEEMERDMPFDIFSDLEAMYRTYEELRELRDRGADVVAGHDPRVMASHPRLEGAAGEFAVRVA